MTGAGHRRRRACVATVIGLVGTFITVGCSSPVDSHPVAVESASGESTVVTVAPPSPSGPGGVAPAERPLPVGARPTVEIASSAPVGVRIPRIGITSSLQALGLNEDSSIQAPTEWQEAGWFAAGVEPGQPGPAVIAGHVDSVDGPAVFYRVDELVPGDEVLVDRADGSTVRFLVTGSDRFPKDEFPTEVVYGPATGPELRLVTCGGPFDRSSGHYRQNVVVFAVADAT